MMVWLLRDFLLLFVSLPGSIVSSSRHATDMLPQSRLSKLASYAATEEDVFADVDKSTPTKEAPKQNATAASAEDQSGKRVRQFLALEPVEGDPSEGNQWAVDMKSENLSADESRKKLTAIVTGGLTLFFGLSYFAIVLLAENRDPADVEQVRSSSLSKEEIALLGDLGR
eukprot:CAMPEP_0178407276 /NCGR_PEP_ID=MMETSP0689_2-20121128/19346_1 /TAXON_ID=160604 /ORGANISM="Amphidinium massartii, Strain CS-259" /LENGTH=169 /DNA_ID=CAMNT_0020028347 /DNA_START=194 /DNA_END=703 /DNA_ORIENTATION=-